MRSISLRTIAFVGIMVSILFLIPEQLPARNLCPEELLIGVITSHHPLLKNVTIFFLVSSEPSGIVAFALDREGPFTDPLVVPVKLDAQGDGQSTFFAKGLTFGETVAKAVSNLGDVLPPMPITVPEVSAVVFEALDSPLDANTNPGGGLRIFPDKQSAIDPVPSNKVKVRATVSPPTATVFFRSFDIDDPSNSKVVDRNGSKGDDNRGTPKAGTLSALSAAASGSVAEVRFTVTMQPGDNFKVAAGCSQNYLDGVVVDGVNLKDADGNTLSTTRAQVTDMLTVWRRLHIEVDSMASVFGNKVTGTITKASPTAKGTGTELTVTVDDPSLDTSSGRFELGIIDIDGVGVFGVSTNSKNTVTIPFVVSEVQVAGKSFTLIDDDDFNGDNILDGDAGKNVPAPDLSLIHDSLDNGVCDNSALNVFADAYVCPVFDVGNNNDFVAFKLNTLAATTEALIGTYEFNSGPGEDKDFWTVYLLGAYQFVTEEDLDPNKEGGTLGAVDAFVGQGVSVFFEALADTQRQDGLVFGCSNKAVVAHEIGHLFDAPHKDRGLMSSPCGKITPSFSDKTLSRIRQIPHP